MMPKPAIVTGLLLIVAVLAFAGLAYQTVPMSTTSTATSSFTRNWTSYAPYSMTGTATHRSTTFWTVTSAFWAGALNGWNYACQVNGDCGVGYATSTYSVVLPPFLITYGVQRTSAFLEAQTLTSSTTQSSTSIVPASTALGLTDATFTTLVALVIGILALLTGWVALKSRGSAHRPKQATPS